jgi:hypothetical protein
MFWIPSVSQTFIYTEIIPPDAPPIHFTFGSGGLLRFRQGQ